MHGAIHAVGVDEIGVDLEGIRVDIHRVRTLGEIHQHGAIGSLGIPVRIIIIGIIAGKHVLVDHIHELCVPKSLPHLQLTIPHDTVANQLLPIVGEDAAIQEIGIVGLGVVVTGFRIDMALTVFYIGGAKDTSDSRLSVVMQRIRDESGLGFSRGCRIKQLDIVVEDSLAGSWVILSPIAGQLVPLIEQFASFEEISQIVEAVVVEAIRVKFRFEMLQNHIVTHTGQLIQTVIVKHVARQGERIALQHAHIAESIKRIRGFVEKSAIAIHQGSFVLELDVAYQKLSRAIDILVEIKLVGMKQVNPAVRRPSGGRFPLLGWRHSKHDIQTKQG